MTGLKTQLKRGKICGFGKEPPIFFFLKYTAINKFIHFFICMACGILVPQPGMEPLAPASEVQCLNHRAIDNVPNFSTLELLSVSQDPQARSCSGRTRLQERLTEVLKF